MIGTSLGPYKIIEQRGAGGMGEVYLGEDTRLGRKVAIKVLPAEFASDPERLARSIECRFTIVEIDERNRARADAVFENQHGDTVIEAEVTGIVPGPPERKILETMQAEGDPTNGRH